jgi:hypothetical protein
MAEVLKIRSEWKNPFKLKFQGLRSIDRFFRLDPERRKGRPCGRPESLSILFD